jgi:hypothetical protein
VVVICERIARRTCAPSTGGTASHGLGRIGKAGVVDPAHSDATAGAAARRRARAGRALLEAVVTAAEERGSTN